MRKCYLERDVCGEHVWYSEERNVIWNQTNRNWKIFTSFALTWKYAYKKKKQVKLMITWIPTKILFNCTIRLTEIKIFVVGLRISPNPLYPWMKIVADWLNMVNIVCKEVDVGTNEKSILCIKKQQIRRLDLWSRGWRMLDIMEGGMNEKKKKPRNE